METKNIISALEHLNVRYSLYFRTKNTAPVFFANHSLFRSASIIKVPILLAWLELEKQGEVDRKELCRLDDEPAVGGAGFGSQFLTRSLAYADVLLMMLATSDNLCTNLILRKVGLERLREVLQSKLGLHKTRCERKLMDYAARERGLDNYIDAEEAIQLFRLVDGLAPEDRAWVKSMLLANTDSALLMRNIPRDTIDFFHKTGSMTGVLHDWGFTDQCEVFLFTENVTNEPAVFEIFGSLGQACLMQE